MKLVGAIAAWFAALWVAWILGGCASTVAVDASSEEGWHDSIDAVATELVDAAERRGDLRGARVEIRTPGLDDALAARGGRDAVEVARRVRAELEFLLSARLDVVVHARELDARAPFAATHAVDGQLEERDGRLRLSLRLLSLESGLVLAPARGPLALGLDEAALLAPAPGPTQHQVPGVEGDHLPLPANDAAAAQATTAGSGPAGARLGALAKD